MASQSLPLRFDVDSLGEAVDLLVASHYRAPLADDI